MKKNFLSVLIASAAIIIASLFADGIAASAANEASKRHSLILLIYQGLIKRYEMLIRV